MKILISDKSQIHYSGCNSRGFRLYIRKLIKSNKKKGQWKTYSFVLEIKPDYCWVI